MEVQFLVLNGVHEDVDQIFCKGLVFKQQEATELPADPEQQFSEEWYRLLCYAQSKPPLEENTEFARAFQEALWKALELP